MMRYMLLVAALIPISPMLADSEENSLVIPLMTADGIALDKEEDLELCQTLLTQVVKEMTRFYNLGVSNFYCRKYSAGSWAIALRFDRPFPPTAPSMLPTVFISRRASGPFLEYTRPRPVTETRNATTLRLSRDDDIVAREYQYTVHVSVFETVSVDLSAGYVGESARTEIVRSEFRESVTFGDLFGQVVSYVDDELTIVGIGTYTDFKRSRGCSEGFAAFE